jgi:hypothetical protein
VQAGERGDREVAFYEAIEQHRQAQDTTAAAAADTGPGNRPGQSAAAHIPDDADQAAATMQRLAEWVPRSCEWRPHRCMLQCARVYDGWQVLQQYTWHMHVTLNRPVRSLMRRGSRLRQWQVAHIQTSMQGSLAAVVTAAAAASWSAPCGRHALPGAGGPHGAVQPAMHSGRQGACTVGCCTRADVSLQYLFCLLTPVGALT